MAVFEYDDGRGADRLSAEPLDPARPINLAGSGNQVARHAASLLAICALAVLAFACIAAPRSAYAFDLQGATLGEVFGQAASSEPGFVADKVYGVVGGDYAVVSSGKELQVVDKDYGITLSLPGKGEQGPLSRYYCIGGEPVLVDDGFVVFDSVSKQHGVLSIDGTSFTPLSDLPPSADEPDDLFYDADELYQFAVYGPQNGKPARIEMRLYDDDDLIDAYEIADGSFGYTRVEADGLICTYVATVDEDGYESEEARYLSFDETGMKEISFDSLGGDYTKAYDIYYVDGLFSAWAEKRVYDEEDDEYGYDEFDDVRVWFTKDGKHLPAFDDFSYAGQLTDGRIAFTKSSTRWIDGYDDEDESDLGEVIQVIASEEVHIVQPDGTKDRQFTVTETFDGEDAAMLRDDMGTYSHYVYFAYVPERAWSDSNPLPTGTYEGFVKFYDANTGTMAKELPTTVSVNGSGDASATGIYDEGPYLCLESPDGDMQHLDADLAEVSGRSFRIVWKDKLHVSFGGTELYRFETESADGGYDTRIGDASGNPVKAGDYTIDKTAGTQWRLPGYNYGPVKHPDADAFCVTDGQGHYGAVDSNSDVVIPVEYANVLFYAAEAPGAIVLSDDGTSYWFDFATKSVKEPAERTDLSSAVVSVAGQTYTGAGLKPTPAVTLAGKTLDAGTDYNVNYASNVNAGTGTVIVTGKGAYKGSATARFAIAKASQTVNVSSKAAKTVKFKAKKLKKKKASFQIGATAAAGTKLTYALDKKAKKSKKISVSKTGKVTLKKGLKKGTYKITVTATNANYTTATRTVKIKVS